MKNIKDRAGRVIIRVGGNTQEKAVFFPEGLPNGATILKTGVNPNTPVCMLFLIYFSANIHLDRYTYY